MRARRWPTPKGAGPRLPGSGDVLHHRLRGRQRPHRLRRRRVHDRNRHRVRYADATGPLSLRADSGYYSGKVTASCRAAGVPYSITAKLNPAIHKALAKIAETAWTPIPYWLNDGADVPETTYQPFGGTAPVVRLIVRRVRPTPRTQPLPVHRMVLPRPHH